MHTVNMPDKSKRTRITLATVDPWRVKRGQSRPPHEAIAESWRSAESGAGRGVEEATVVYRIRKNSLVEDVYLSRDGKWTTWERAAKFTSVEALERFVAECGIEVFGIF